MRWRRYFTAVNVTWSSPITSRRSQIVDRRSCSWPTYQKCFAWDFILTRAKFTIHALRLSLNGFDCDADHYIYEPMHLAVCHYLVGILLRWAWPTATATACRWRRRVAWVGVVGDQTRYNANELQPPETVIKLTELCNTWAQSTPMRQLTN